MTLENVPERTHIHRASTITLLLAEIRAKEMGFLEKKKNDSYENRNHTGLKFI